MPRVAIKTSPRVGQLLRERREALGWTLREVEAKTAEVGHPIPHSTLGRVERGKIDPGLRRLHVLFRLYDLPIDVLSDLLDMEEFATGDVAGGSPAEIRERALAAWKAGDLRGGLSGLAALRVMTSDDPAERAERREALLALAITTAGLGRFNLALTIVDQLLLEPAEPAFLVRVLLQGAACWQRLGSTEMALALLNRAETHADPARPEEQAWLMHQAASVMATMGEHARARSASRRARTLYQSTGDTHGEALLLGVDCRIHRDLGEHEAAARCARQAREFALEHGHRRPATLRRLDEGRALLMLGRREEAMAALSEGLGEAVGMDDPVAQFYAHYCLWRAYLGSDETERAAMALQHARYFVARIDIDAPEAAEVRSGAPAA